MASNTLEKGSAVPLRQASSSSVKSDDAVPTTDPRDVSVALLIVG
jgi:hypothetical protein